MLAGLSTKGVRKKLVTCSTTARALAWWGHGKQTGVLNEFPFDKPLVVCVTTRQYSYNEREREKTPYTQWPQGDSLREIKPYVENIRF